MSTFLAIDFGAGSGRVIAGHISGNQLEMEEIHRFGNRQVHFGHHLHWDFPSLFAQMKDGIRQAASKYKDIKSIGIDTWGVDYGLVDRCGNLMGNPICYRDPFTANLSKEVFSFIDEKEHYQQAGIQVMDINTIFQLYAWKRENEAMLTGAAHLLFMPDLFAYYLTGNAFNEYSIASTSELLEVRTRKWNWSLIRELGLPEHIFGEIIMPGQAYGTLLPEVASELGLSTEIKVVAVGSHDTASAIFAAPLQEGKVSAFLSSGTWSLLGIELDQPILGEQARIGGFTNEGGVGGKICFLQNITGLWMLQRLMGKWRAEGKPTDYDYLLGEAARVCAAPTVDVDSTKFMNPLDMENAIVQYCEHRGVKAPKTQGEFVACVLQSLAERYRIGITLLNSLLPRPVECLHIIGGGSRNWLLNNLTAAATGVPVIAGPVEATAIGNILVQGLASKDITNKDDVKVIEK